MPIKTAYREGTWRAHSISQDFKTPIMSRGGGDVEKQELLNTSERSAY